MLMDIRGIGFIGYQFLDIRVNRWRSMNLMYLDK